MSEIFHMPLELHVATAVYRTADKPCTRKADFHITAALHADVCLALSHEIVYIYIPTAVNLYNGIVADYVFHIYIAAALHGNHEIVGIQFAGNVEITTAYY